jgi:Predicted nucleic acid-binding protein, contains PIN domain
MTRTTHALADTSALVRLAWPQVAAVLAPRIRAGTVGTCGIIDLELLALIPDSADVGEIREHRKAAFPWLATHDDDWRRALTVQALLVEAGHHPVRWPKLMVAAVAERHDVTLLHYDPVFVLITKATGQNAEWIVPEGSLD